MRWEREGQRPPVQGEVVMKDRLCVRQNEDGRALGEYRVRLQGCDEQSLPVL